MARVAEHLSVAELQAGYRGSKDAVLASLRAIDASAGPVAAEPGRSRVSA